MPITLRHPSKRYPPQHYTPAPFPTPYHLHRPKKPNHRSHLPNSLKNPPLPTLTKPSAIHKSHSTRSPAPSPSSSLTLSPSSARTEANRARVARWYARYMLRYPPLVAAVAVMVPLVQVGNDPGGAIVESVEASGEQGGSGR
ncbi:hypothetical protein ACLMJK_008394 [Lecanora helva]